MLSGIPATSLWGLRARAEEHQKPQGLFKDAMALAWYEKLQPFMSDEVNKWYHPILQKSIAIRSDILDWAVLKHVSTTKRAVIVELGCGFSTRYFRIQNSESLWYELDLAELIEVRQSLAKPGENQWQIVGSVFDISWLEYLKEYDPQEVFFIAEGLFMYFPEKQFTTLLAELKRHFPGAKLALDVMGKLNLKAAQHPAEEVEAPMYWGVDQLSKFYQTHALTPLDDLSIFAQSKRQSLYKAYIPPLARGLMSFDWIRQRMGGTVLVGL